MTIFINKSAVYADEGNLVVISSDKQQLKNGDILTYSLDMQTFAEYYLLGTLISTACVVICKMLILR